MTEPPGETNHGVTTGVTPDVPLGTRSICAARPLPEVSVVRLAPFLSRIKKKKLLRSNVLVGESPLNVTSKDRVLPNVMPSLYSLEPDTVVSVFVKINPGGEVGSSRNVSIGNHGAWVEESTNH